MIAKIMWKLHMWLHRHHDGEVVRGFMYDNDLYVCHTCNRYWRQS